MARSASGWKDNVADLVDLTTADDDWFARSGRDAILAHIEQVERGRPFDPQREFLRQLIEAGTRSGHRR